MPIHSAIRDKGQNAPVFHLMTPFSNITDTVIIDAKVKEKKQSHHTPSSLAFDYPDSATRWPRGYKFSTKRREKSAYLL